MLPSVHIFSFCEEGLSLSYPPKTPCLILVGAITLSALASGLSCPHARTGYIPALCCCWHWHRDGVPHPGEHMPRTNAAETAFEPFFVCVISCSWPLRCHKLLDRLAFLPQMREKNPFRCHRCGWDGVTSCWTVLSSSIE